MQFTDRHQAGILLAQSLKGWFNEPGIVYGVPRGGVPVAYEIATLLKWPLEIVLAKKIGHPGNPEYAIGAAGISTMSVLVTDGIPESYISEEVGRIRSQLQLMQDLYMNGRKPLDVSGKIAIVVDDGVATGNTLLMTLGILREQHPRQVVVAVPVASTEAASKIRHAADAVILLHETSHFRSVGQFYADFNPTSDSEVQALLQKNFDAIQSC